MSEVLNSWDVVIAVPFPCGVSIHPRTYDKVDTEIGRICIIDTKYEGIRIGTDAHGDNFKEATDDALKTANRLLSILKITKPTDVYIGLFDRDNPDHYKARFYLLPD